MWRREMAGPALAALLCAGCATTPLGPTVRVLPAPTKPFEVFQLDDQACRAWAAQQLGTDPATVANENLAKGGVAGALIGGGLGALIGSASADAGLGAAIGAGFGLLGGLAAASGPAYASAAVLQRRYDLAYEQCMYANGNLVGGMPAPVVTMPPPPPGVPSAPTLQPPPPPPARPPQ